MRLNSSKHAHAPDFRVEEFGFGVWCSGFRVRVWRGEGERERGCEGERVRGGEGERERGKDG